MITYAFLEGTCPVVGDRVFGPDDPALGPMGETPGSSSMSVATVIRTRSFAAYERASRTVASSIRFDRPMRLTRDAALELPGLGVRAVRQRNRRRNLTKVTVASPRR